MQADDLMASVFPDAAGVPGRHRYLVVDAAQKDKVIQTYVETASAKPAVRAPRFRGGKKNQDPPKATDPPKKQ